MNVALYGTPRRWAMTERGRGDLRRDATTISIGASAMRWDGATLTIDIDETTVPFPSRLRGQVILRPRAVSGRRFMLDAEARHRWQPIAPLSDVTVAFENPALSWRGIGYFDTNDGDAPLEAGFRSWTWSRFDLKERARIFYDVVLRDGTKRGLSLDVHDGVVADGPPAHYQALKTTGWGIARQAPCDPQGTPTLIRTLESAPFYARSALRSRIDGSEVLGVHESLSLTRVASPIVRLMLPFKMFRAVTRGNTTSWNQMRQASTESRVRN